jgi:polyribonucleotide nucleotidyltransferase
MSNSISIPNLGKSELRFSTGVWAKQANGSVCVSCGDTVVLATACMSDNSAPGRDFFPLMVEYQEKTYAMGKIPGGFFKKEGRPKDQEMLNARLIDRPIRPLFPKGMTNEVQIVAMCLSSDAKNDPDILAVNGASCALMISDIPFDEPVGAVRVSKVADELMVNPTYQDRAQSTMDVVVVGTEKRIIMLEAESKQVSEEQVFEAIAFAQPFIKQIIDSQKQLRDKVGKPKKEVTLSVPKKELIEQIRSKVYDALVEIYCLTEKAEKKEKTSQILSSLTDELVSDESEISESDIKSALDSIFEEILRKQILDKEKRPDGRGIMDIRPIDCQVGALPRTHGSAVFTRGQTQALAVVALGTSSDEQRIETLEGETTKHFMLHYMFPPFSVGEVKFMRGPSRRDIGHGALAEKALAQVVPSKDEFPYTIRVVSEILESNGSSSMATTCAASLSMMDAGIPLKQPVAGIAIGLIADEQDENKYKILTDIQGAEDHYGDMDFKVAGTKDGITAIQLDTKIHGLTLAMIKDTLNSAKTARLAILEKMNQAIGAPRDNLSEYAPKIESFEVDPDKIGAIIGPGGKTIKRIQRENNVTVDIDDETNVVSVAAGNSEDLQRAVKLITNLIKDIEVGEVYEVRVEKIVNFGAFCEIAPGKSGLVHVSELSDGFVKEVTDVVKEGDLVTAKVIGVDPQGKIRLSIKQAK